MTPPSCFTFRRLPACDVSAAYRLETAGYPSSEAASLETLSERQRLAPNLFYGAYSGDELVGFIVGTATRSEELTHESMARHEDDGQAVAVHSVCVESTWQRQGVARYMLGAYKASLKEQARYKTILLISHQELIGLYEKAGFTLVGLSSVKHGPREWYELRQAI